MRCASRSEPDIDAAQHHCDTALRIDPKRRGAQEYAGELALMKGDLPAAEARLATLGQLCSSPCEPLDELKTAVAPATSRPASGEPVAPAAAASSAVRCPFLYLHRSGSKRSLRFARIGKS